jgi:DUF917 family protein
MHLAGVTASPVVMTDCRGDTIVIRAGDDRRAERLARRAADGLGGVSAAAMCCMPGERVRDAAIPGSVSLAVELGRALGADGMEARCAGLAGAVGAVVLIEGKVLDVEYSQAGSAPRGSTTIDGTGAYAGRQLRIELQNEFLVALEDGAVQAAGPDLISVLSADDGDPIGTESLRRARRVVVVAVAAPQLWRTDEALDVAGPSAFGYQLDGA